MVFVAPLPEVKSSELLWIKSSQQGVYVNHLVTYYFDITSIYYEFGRCNCYLKHTSFFFNKQKYHSSISIYKIYLCLFYL